MQRIGVFVCWCGSNIAGTVDVKAVSEALKNEPGVVFSTNYQYMCSQAGQNLIKDAIKEHHLTGIVVCSCSPRMHENTFRKTAQSAGINPYMVEIANVREQCSWVHKDMPVGTEKAIILGKAAVAKAVEERTAIVEKAEALAASLGDNTNWRSTADKFRNLFDEWQNHQRTTIRIDKPEAEALWKRFSAARTTFNQSRRKWAQARDNERSQAKEAKEAIIAEANELKDSTAWGETSRKFNELMDRWKKAGRAGRNEDDALWAKFREAADTFFNARQADRDQINSSEKENLAAKEALLVKAEALVPVKTDAEAKKARQELAKIQEEWDQIGYVPRDAMRRIEGRLDAVDKQIKAIEDAAWKQTDPEADARKSSFEEQLHAQLAVLDEKIAAESDPKKKAKLEAEKATKEQWLNAIK